MEQPKKRATAMRDNSKIAGRYDELWTVPSASGDDCFKRTEEMDFGPASHRHSCYCDDVKRDVALKGDTTTYLQPGGFSWTNC